MSPALAGGFLTTVPLGKPLELTLKGQRDQQEKGKRERGKREVKGIKGKKRTSSQAHLLQYYKFSNSFFHS